MPKLTKRERQLLAAIDQHLVHALGARPEMFFQSPESCEDVLTTLDQVRSIILLRKDDFCCGEEFGFLTYLSCSGFGSARPVGRLRIDRKVQGKPKPTQAELWATVLKAWKKYTLSSFYPQIEE